MLVTRPKKRLLSLRPKNTGTLSAILDISSLTRTQTTIHRWGAFVFSFFFSRRRCCCWWGWRRPLLPPSNNNKRGA